MAATTPDIAELAWQQAIVRKFNQDLTRLLGQAGSDPQSMIDLQMLITKRNEAYELQAEMLRKQQQALHGIINNMR